jgi:hypothetical protein
VELVLGLLLGLFVGTSLGIIGAGGAILAVPGLVAVLGLDAKTATTASTIIVGSAAAAGFIQRIKTRALDFKIGITFSLLGVGGTFLGTYLLQFLSDTFILVLFSLLMFGAAFGMWRKSVEERPAVKPQWWLVILSATGVGLATGLLGIGGGFLIVPALVLFLKVPTKIAAGTSLVAITLNSVVTFLLRNKYWSEMPWAPVLAFASSAVLASFFTARFAQKFQPKQLQRGFATLIVIVAFYMLITRFF